MTSTIEFVNRVLDIMDGSHAIFPGFSKPKAPAPLPAPPKIDDPAVTAARERLRLSEKRRKGRRAAILTSNRGVENNSPVIKRSSALGGITNEKLSTTGI